MPTWCEIVYIYYQVQSQDIQWTIKSLWWLCLDLELTPTEIYDVTWNPRIPKNRPIFDGTEPLHEEARKRVRMFMAKRALNIDGVLLFSQSIRISESSIVLPLEIPLTLDSLSFLTHGCCEATSVSLCGYWVWALKQWEMTSLLCARYLPANQGFILNRKSGSTTRSTFVRKYRRGGKTIRISVQFARSKSTPNCQH